MKDPYLYLLPWLEDTDVTTWSFIISTITLFIFAYILLFFTVCIVSFFSERFRALGDADKFIWCAKGVKVLYFPIPISIGLWYLLVDDTLKDDVVNGITKTAFVATYMHIGHYLVDSALMVVGNLLYDCRFSTVLLVHHSIVINVFIAATYYSGKGQYFIMISFVDDMAGISSCVNWMLGKAKLTRLSIWKVSQQISVYLWHFRTMLEFYYFYIIIKNWSYIWNDMPLPPLITSSSCVLLVMIGLTPHWTKVEAKRLYKQYTRKISFYMKAQDKNTNKTL